MHKRSKVVSRKRIKRVLNRFKAMNPHERYKYLNLVASRGSPQLVSVYEVLVTQGLITEGDFTESRRRRHGETAPLKKLRRLEDSTRARARAIERIMALPAELAALELAKMDESDSGDPWAALAGYAEMVYEYAKGVKVAYFDPLREADKVSAASEQPVS